MVDNIVSELLPDIGLALGVKLAYVYLSSYHLPSVMPMLFVGTHPLMYQDRPQPLLINRI